MNLTAATVQKDFLDPALDGRSHNTRQERIVFDPSPECDSLLEYANELLAHGVKPAVVDRIVGLLRELIESNQAEGECHRTVAGAADSLQRLLAGRERNGLSEALSAKAVAQQLLPALAVLSDLSGQSAAKIVNASGVVKRIIDSVPATQLLSPTVAKALRPTKYELLRTLVEGHQAGHGDEEATV